ncbi:MAG: phosphatidate cytidylyltransferase [Propionibacteriaceae bacterium]|nr:phosphatidate cytidylyltransferase [Propionibacteriaceae bacterium]
MSGSDSDTDAQSSAGVGESSRAPLTGSGDQDAAAQAPSSTHDRHGHRHVPSGAEATVEHALTEFADATQHAVAEVNRRAGRDIIAAVGVAIVILAALGSTLVWFPWGFVVIVALGVAAAQIELSGVLAAKRQVRVQKVPLIAGSVVLALGSYAVDAFGLMSPALLAVWVVGLTSVVILVVRLAGPTSGYLRDVGASVFLLIYPGLLASGVVSLLSHDQGPWWVATLVVGVAATDTGGYLVGVVIGKHQFAPRISPKKSWEGVAGSVVLAGCLVTLMVTVLLHQTWWKGVILAMVIVVTAIAGDLVESVIKRDLGVKDMGDLLPGHGGVMDRVDGYILAAFPTWLTMVFLFGGV